jgi:hypothetical protein
MRFDNPLIFLQTNCNISKHNMSDKGSDRRRGPPPGELPKPEKLPPSLQKIIDKADKEDNFYDELYDGK